jgi:predicted DsbA family dithiol-disulfide isomerase
MTIEIWSDIACPFCYIGKRRFERALEQYEGKKDVQVIWRSFQLDPTVQTNPEMDATAMLAAKKGWSLEQTRQIQQNVTQMAAESGLEYHFDRLVVANTFDAHRFLHAAKKYGKQKEAGEAVFAGHFTHGKNIGDHAVLAEMGAAIGMDATALKQTLAGEEFGAAVAEDIELARQFGINSVPFFVFDRKHAVSGAQPESVFLGALQR